MILYSEKELLLQYFVFFSYTCTIVITDVVTDKRHYYLKKVMLCAMPLQSSSFGTHLEPALDENTCVGIKLTLYTFECFFFSDT